MENQTNKDKTRIENELVSMRQHVSNLELELQIQREIAYAAGVFKGDITIRTLLESLAEGVVVCNPKGYIVLINRRAEEMFGYTAEEVIGRSLNIFLPERFFNIHNQHVESFFDAPEIRRMGTGRDLTAKRKDGTEFPVEVSLSYLDTEVGRLAIAFVSDITQRKQAEWALKLRNEELDAFAHTVAHDLKSSLAKIIGYSEVLVDIQASLSREEITKYLTALAESGRKMNNIIDELLVFASVRKEEVKLQPVDMWAVVNNVLQRLQYMLRDYNAQVTLPDSFPQAMGQAAWLEEVWLNYLTNAIKYGGRPPVIELGYTRLDDNRIKYWVKDNGEGLTREQQKNLFVSFARLNVPYHIEGYGLGLSIVKRIIDKLGGEVGVESEPGKGSIFSFTLRAAPAD
ncbi:MAG: sensor histidine kinase [Chloroflexi bacterium]|nr:MAG: sensor histidine kinase [Chloroflexota bacterium]